MATGELLVLDGLTFSGDDFTQNFTLETFDPGVAKERLEWAQTADSEGAALLRTPQHENAETTMRVRVKQQATMDAALDLIGTLRDKFRKAQITDGGIPLTWTPAGSTRTWTTNVLTGSIDGLPITWSGDDVGWFQRNPVVPVTLTRGPYWTGTEVLTSTATSSTPFVTLEVPNVPGDIPALGRLIVTDSATQARRHVEWGLENQFYNSATSLLMDSDSMVTTGFAGAQGTRAGSYDPDAAGNNVITYTTTPVVAAMAGLPTTMAHVGTFRVKARVWASDVAAGVRLAWKVGDTRLLTNAFAYAPVANVWTEVDLGVVVIPPVLAGTQRWAGQIECYSAPGGVTVSLDYVTLVPAGEGYGKARGPTMLDTVTTFSAHDEFDQTSGGLAGKAAPQGGTWAGAGDADDFFVDATYHTLTRGGVSDIDQYTGRYATLGATNYTDVLVQADMWRTGVSAYPGPNVGRQGVLARYVSANTWLWAGLDTLYQPLSQYAVKLIMLSGGAATTLGTFALPTGEASALGATIRLIVDAQGVATVFYGSNATLGVTDRAMRRVIVASHAALATGGALATGKPGVYDVWTGSLALGRSMDNFFVTVPTPNQVIYSTRNMQVRYDDTIRQDSTGAIYGKPPMYRGTRFLVPPGTSRVLVKARRQDVDKNPDDNVTDSTTIQVAWTPRSLAVPR